MGMQSGMLRNERSQRRRVRSQAHQPRRHSADGSGGPVEVGADLGCEAGAVARGDAGFVEHQGQGPLLELAHPFRHGAAGHAQCQIGFPQAIEAAVLQHRRVAEIGGDQGRLLLWR